MRRLNRITAALALATAGLPALPAVAPAARDSVSLTWGGDVTLGSSYGRPPRRGWPQLAPIARVLRASDVTALNYEGTFAPGGASKCSGGSPLCFAFQAPARNAASLRRAGVDIANLANNHAYDFGPRGYASTRRALRRTGVVPTGGAAEIRVLERHGTRMAFVGFSSYPWSAPLNDPGGVRRLVGQAARRAEIVAVLFHGGAEGADRTHTPGGREHAFGEDRGNLRAFAHTAIDAGADLVLGSGPHVLRGMEAYRHRLIAYSVGNLTGWHNFSTSGPLLSLSALITVQVAPDGRFEEGEIVSLRLDGTGVPHRDRSERGAALMRRLSRSDFRGRMRFQRLGTAEEGRGRIRR
jgi:poly-gamma-glutamate capsule biosynthesis protein CapA/YwtB (metallophosphatase superfamily)